MGLRCRGMPNIKWSRWLVCRWRFAYRRRHVDLMGQLQDGIGRRDGGGNDAGILLQPSNWANPH